MLLYKSFIHIFSIFILLSACISTIQSSTLTSFSRCLHKVNEYLSTTTIVIKLAVKKPGYKEAGHKIDCLGNLVD